MVRNCAGKHPSARSPFVMRIFDKDTDRCPISLITKEASSVIQILNVCDGGMGGSSILPSALMEETQYFLNVKQIVSSERARLSSIDKKKSL